MPLYLIICKGTDTVSFELLSYYQETDVLIQGHDVERQVEYDANEARQTD